MTSLSCLTLSHTKGHGRGPRVAAAREGGGEFAAGEMVLGELTYI